MKFIVYMLISGILLGACRARKEKNMLLHSKNQESTTTSHSAMYSWQQQDSSHRYWSYSSDTVFFYHPDKGLYGHRGDLYLEESQLMSKIQLSKDSGLSQREQHTESIANYSAILKKPNIVWTVIILVFAAVFSYFLRKYRR